MTVALAPVDYVKAQTDVDERRRFIDSPFADEVALAETELTLALTRYLARLGRSVIKALRQLAGDQVIKSKQTSPSLPDSRTMFKALMDIIYVPEVWLTARRQFTADFTEITQRMTAQGVSQAGRMVGGVNFDLANETVFSLSSGYTNEWYSAIGDSTSRQLREAIASHIRSGAALPKLTKTLTPLFGPGRARVIAATEVTRLFALGNSIGYRTAGITVIEWRTTFDQRVCGQCSARNGEHYSIGGSSISGGLGVSEGTRPPAHPACLPGWVEVVASDVRAVSKRMYEGDLIVINTASGKQLTTTPNHPVLTVESWVAAGDLGPGSNVICGVRANDIKRPSGSPMVDDDNVPTSIEQVANAYGHAHESSAVEVPSSPGQFHGDGVGSKVAVIWSDSLLGDSRYPSVCEHGVELGFVGRRSSDSFNRLGLLDNDLDRGNSATSTLVRVDDLISSLLRSHPAPLEQFGLTLAPDGNTLLKQVDADGRAVDAQVLCNLILGCPTKVSADQVVSVERYPFHGYVYNLQTKAGAYLANGIITHNCRCWIAPVVDGKPVLRSGQNVEDIIKREADRIRGNSTETGLFINSRGRIILDKSQGSIDSVAFTAAEMRRARNIHMLHNHPSGNSFSDVDIDLAARGNVRSMRVAGSGKGDVLTAYDYTLYRPKSGWGDIDEIKRVIKVNNSEIRREFESAIEAGTMTIPEANGRHWHELWLRVSRQLGWTYKRVEA